MRAMISARRLGPLLPEAKASQPDRDVHFGALNLGLQHIIVRSGQSVQEVPDGWFSVSISVGVKTVPRSVECQKTERNYAKISVRSHSPLLPLVHAACA
jgi:hypothetical protein